LKQYFRNLIFWVIRCRGQRLLIWAHRKSGSWSVGKCNVWKISAWWAISKIIVKFSVTHYHQKQLYLAQITGMDLYISHLQRSTDWDRIFVISSLE
jgi:hypothetical protein